MLFISLLCVCLCVWWMGHLSVIQKLPDQVFFGTSFPSRNQLRPPPWVRCWSCRSVCSAYSRYSQPVAAAAASSADPGSEQVDMVCIYPHPYCSPYFQSQMHKPLPKAEVPNTVLLKRQCFWTAVSRPDQSRNSYFLVCPGGRLTAGVWASIMSDFVSWSP